MHQSHSSQINQSNKQSINQSINHFVPHRRTTTHRQARVWDKIVAQVLGLNGGKYVASRRLAGGRRMMARPAARRRSIPMLLLLVLLAISLVPHATGLTEYLDAAAVARTEVRSLGLKSSRRTAGLRAPSIDRSIEPFTGFSINPHPTAARPR